MSSYGTRASYCDTSCDFVFTLCFFQSDRLIQYQETHSTLNEKNKGGWLNRNILILKCENTSFGNRS